MTRVPVVGSDANAWGTVLNDFLGVGHNSDGTLKNQPFINVKLFGAAVDSSTDDSAAINNAIAAASAAGGGFVIIPGVSAVNSPITLNGANVVLLATGAGGGLRPLATFSGSQVVLITADFCGVRDLTIAYANTTYSSNPAADGIRITGCRSGTLSNVYLNYINGWAVHSTGTGSVANYWWQFINAHAFQCASGMRIAGNTLSGFNMAHSVTNCVMDQIQNSDAYQIEDSHDVTLTNIEGSVTAGSGNTLHIKGACAAIYLANGDLGPAPGPGSGATVQFDSNGNGSPTQVSLLNSIFEGGLTGVTINAGTELMFRNCDLIRNGTHGFSITAGDAIIISGCLFDLNGATAAVGHYDINQSTTGGVMIESCWFWTPQGTTANHVAACINSTAGTMTVQNCTFNGVGFNSSNILAGFPSVIRNCRGYNPVGNVSVSVPSSTVNFATKSTDLTYFVTGGTVTIIKIGGVATGLTSGAFRVPAQQTLNITYSVVPSVTAFAD